MVTFGCFFATFFAPRAFIIMMIARIATIRSAIHVDNDSNAADEARLIAQARSDPDAFIQLYRRYYDAIFRYCAHRLFERQAAEDATSQVFLKAVEHFDRFKGDAPHFRGWLYRIAGNVASDHLRKAARRQRLIERASREHNIRIVGGASAVESSNDKSAMLREAILSLKPRYQTIITLRFFENMKSTEIAGLLGRSAGTVRSQLKRALGELRKRLHHPTGGVKND